MKEVPFFNTALQIICEFRAIVKVKAVGQNEKNKQYCHSDIQPFAFKIVNNNNKPKRRPQTWSRAASNQQQSEWLSQLELKLSGLRHHSKGRGRQ